MLGMKKSSWLLLSVVVVATQNVFAGSVNSDPAVQRRMFQDAEKALTAGKTQQYEKLYEQLAQYPLRPYLDFDQLTRKFSTAKPADIKTFIKDHRNTLLGERMQNAWLVHLAMSQQTAALVDAYSPGGNVALECFYRRALLAEKRSADAFKGLQGFWLVGDEQPDSCGPLFDAWRKAGGLTDDLVWDRIQLVVRSGNFRFARYLGLMLPVADRKWIDVWERVVRNPALVLEAERFVEPTPARTRILAHGMTKLIYRDVNNGSDLWDQLKTKYPFTAEQRAQVERTLMLLLAQNREPAALPRLTSLAIEIETPRIREWRARTAIHEADWGALLTAIEWLTDEEKADPRWQYWHARALESLGFNDDATKIYKQLRQTRNYHAFLAADRLSQPYELENKPLKLSPAELAAAEKIPAVARARELYLLGREGDSRREWDYLVKHANPDDVARAAKVAQHWGWYTRAIFTAAQGNFWNDLGVRFPLVYEKTVVQRAKDFKLEAAWVYGIVRQESAFMEDAKSPRGALGLMQLMPATAKLIAKQEKTSLRKMNELLLPEKNIQLGSAYLKQMRRQLYNHPVLATAAYNAGSGKVRSWLPKERPVSADIWIETIPYDETRDYVERVMAYTVIYDWQLSGKPTQLKNFMTPVLDEDSILTKTQVNPIRDDAG